MGACAQYMQRHLESQYSVSVQEFTVSVWSFLARFIYNGKGICAVSCSNRYNKGLEFYKFPRDPERRRRTMDCFSEQKELETK